MTAARTFTVANIADLDSIKVSIATAATAQTYTGTDLDGASLKPHPDSKTGFAQWPSATASSSAGSYVNGSVITFTGTYKGQTVTRTATVSGTGGNATFIADGPLDGDVTSITVAAQANTSGAWTFGFVDLECPSVGGVAPSYKPWKRCRGSTAANIGFANRDGSDADLVPCTAGETHTFELARLKTSTTSVALLTLYS